MAEKETSVYPIFTELSETWEHLKNDHFVSPGLRVGPFWRPQRFHMRLHRTEKQDHQHGEEIPVYRKKRPK